MPSPSAGAREALQAELQGTGTPAELLGRAHRGLRSELELFANLRPAILYPQLADASSLKPELVADLDILIVRELTEERVEAYRELLRDTERGDTPLAVRATRQPRLAAFRRIEDGVPDLRLVREGRVAAGRGWLGITPREAYLTADVRVSPFLPAWALLLLASLFAVAAWLREGRR